MSQRLNNAELAMAIAATGNAIHKTPTNHQEFEALQKHLRALLAEQLKRATTLKDES